MNTLDRTGVLRLIASIAAVLGLASMIMGGPGHVTAQNETTLEAYITVVIESGDDAVSWSDPDECPSDYNIYQAVRPSGNDSETSRTHLGTAASGSSQATVAVSHSGNSFIIVEVELYCGAYDAASSENDLVASIGLTILGSGHIRDGTYSSAPLAALAISSGTLSPDFDRGLGRYAAEVPNDVEVITLDPTVLTGYQTDFLRNPSWGVVMAYGLDGCTYGYGDGATTGIVLSDADTGTEGFQVNLDRGENRLGIGVNKGEECAHPGGLYALTVTVQNSPATGAPTISGTARVGETLTVESGTSRPFDSSTTANRPFTGSDHDGTGDSPNELGKPNVRVGRSNSGSGRGPINGDFNTRRNNNRPFYGLSAVFRVEGELTPALSIEDGEGDEGGNVTFTVALFPMAAADVTATWSASVQSGDTAVLSDDLGATTGTLTVKAGEPTGTFTVPTAQDNTDEENETFTVTLTDPSSNALIAEATAQGTINDDDDPPVLSVAAVDAQVTEGESATFVLTLTPASGKRVTVPWNAQTATDDTATLGTDFPEDGEVLIFEPGEISKTVTVRTTDDALDEEDEETFSLSLGTANNVTYEGGASVLFVPATILDNDDPPTLSMADVSAEEGDGLTFTVRLSAVSGREVTVDWEAATLDAEGDDAEDGTDYTAGSGTLTFAPATVAVFDEFGSFVSHTLGEERKTFTVATTEDADEEENETFTVSLSNASNASIAEATAKGMIRNDDATLGALPALAQAQTVVRGPYLQSGTSSSAIIKWRTDEATDSLVRYGLAPDSLTLSATNSTSTTEHEVQLTGLSADVKYFYSVGTSSVTLAGGDRDHFFVTAPIPGTAKPTRIWVIGDSGTANRNARAVRDAFLNFTGPRDPDLWIMLGDNAYLDGTDDAYQRAVFNTYSHVLPKTVLWPTLGNHDGHTADSATESGPYYDIFSLPRNGEAGGVPSRTEAYYSFDYGNMHFIVLDSYETDRSPEGAMMTWLEADLQASDKEWVIAFWHHAPYSRGSRDSDTQERMIEMRQNAVPLLERYGVDLVLAGHSHSYERSYLIDGHYGLSETLTDAMKKSPGDGSATATGPIRSPQRLARRTPAPCMS